MTSIVSICNLALSNLGKPSIQSTDEASAEAIACRQFYAITRDMLLQGYPWRFALAVEALAQSADPVVGPWQFAYSRPPTCLKVRAVHSAVIGRDECGRSMGIGYDERGQQILCSVDPAYLEFTQRLDDPTRFPPLFVDAFAWHLAVRLAMPLTRDPKIRADAWQLAQAMQSQAQVSDANEVRESSDIVSEFMAARAAGCEPGPTHAGFRPTDNRDPRTWDDSRFWVE